MSDVNQIAAGEQSEHDLRYGNGGRKQTAAQNRRRRLARTFDQNQLDIEPVLLIDLRFLGHPRNPIGSRQ